MTSKLENFLARPAGDHVPTSGVTSNTPSGMQLAQELRDAVRHASAYAPRSLQVHLGPSEIGIPCHRQVAGKLAATTLTNHVADPWPSYVGTAVHAKLADDLVAERPQQWATERKVTPTEGHSGTADLYDSVWQAVVDHKVQGTSTHTKMRTNGPGRTYFVQLLLYGLGYLLAGLPVRAVAIASWARHGGLDDLYVWWHDLTQEDMDLVQYVINVELPYRKQWAELLKNGQADLMDVPVGDFNEKPVCYFCPLYRPEKKSNPAVAGCPGVS